MVTSVERGTIRSRLLLSGVLEAELADKLSVPPSSAHEVRIQGLVEDGVEVGSGDRVAELDPSELASGLARKRTEMLTGLDQLSLADATGRSAVERALVDLSRAESEMEKAEIEAEIPADLQSARQAAESGLRLDRARTSATKAVAALESARTAARADLEVERLAVERLRREVAEIERVLSDFELRAPKSGVVVIADHPWEGRKLQVGDTVYSGFAIVTLPDLSSLVAVAELSDVDDGRVAPGMPARCVLDAFPDEEIACRVRQISPVAREVARGSQRRAFRTVVELERVDPARHRPGMSVRVEVVRQDLVDVLLVPREALERSGERAIVVLETGERRAIGLGECDRVACAVEAGLDEGERVLIGSGGAGS